MVIDSILLWALLAGILLVLEMLTGTFYLLVLGIGAGVACAAAAQGMSFPAQIIVAAIFGGIGCAVLWLRRSKSNKVTEVNDLVGVAGHTVVVLQRTNRRFRVRYRGTEWDALLVDGDPEGDSFVISGANGSCLLLSEKKGK